MRDQCEPGYRWPLRAESPDLVGREQSPGVWEPGQNPGRAFLLLGQALSLQTPWTGVGGGELGWGAALCPFCQLWAVSSSGKEGPPQVAEPLSQAWGQLGSL